MPCDDVEILHARRSGAGLQQVYQEDRLNFRTVILAKETRKKLGILPANNPLQPYGEQRACRLTI